MFSVSCCLLLLAAVAIAGASSSPIKLANFTTTAKSLSLSESLGCGTNIYGADSDIEEAKKPPQDVVGGQEARPGEFPWIVKVLRKGANHCGGSILNSNYILTAAHCLHSCSSSTTHEPQDITVVVGAHERQKPDHGKVLEVEKLIVHEGYCSQYQKSSPDDIALIKLSQPLSNFQLTEEGYGSVNVVCLPGSQTQYGSGEQFTVAGWGMTSFEPVDFADTLQQVLMPYVDNDQCAEQLQQVVQKHGDKWELNFEPKRELCVGGRENESSCKGDSGGPLMRDLGGGVRELVGVVSRGLACAHKDAPKVYARVDRYLDWIGENTSVDSS